MGGRQTGIWWDVHRVVSLGGGGGLPRLVKALAARVQQAELTAVVASTDSGRSTGIVRRAFGIPGPGDARHCLTTLASGSSPWAELLELRPSTPGHPDLDGVALGNMVLAGLTQQLGDIGQATIHLGRLLGVPVPVLPVSIDTLDLTAELEDGSVVTGELEVRALGKPPIRSVGVTGSGGIWHPVGDVLRSATFITIGPGSLWTSLAAILAIGGVREAVAASHARVVFICNTTTQPGQTDGMDVAGHVTTMHRYLPRPLDYVLVNSAVPSEPLLESLVSDGLHPLHATDVMVSTMETCGTKVIQAPLLEASAERQSHWNKLDTAYHDMNKVADVLEAIMQSSGG